MPANTILKAVVIIMIFSCFSSLVAKAQKFNGSAIMWYMNETKDSRISVKFGTTGINIGGYEGTSLVVYNNTNKKIYVKVRFVITDHCGKEFIRNVEESIQPNDHLGGSTFIGGSEQYDFESTCKEKTKYADYYSTKIKSVRFIYALVREDGEKFPPTPENDSTTTDHSHDNRDTTNPNSGRSNPEQNVNTKDCPTQGLRIVEGPFINCITLGWWTQNTNQINSVTHEFKQTNIPTEYYLSWRKEGAGSWKEIFIPSNMIKYPLTGLDPCTSYEVRIQRNCGNGIRSNYSDVIRFKTTCPAPVKLLVTDIQKNMATVASDRQTFVNWCSSTPISFTRVVEYKSTDSNWEEVFCVWGAPCKLFNLKPATTYRVRMRYKYGVGSYSEYSNETSFTTKQ